MPPETHALSLIGIIESRDNSNRPNSPLEYYLQPPPKAYFSRQPRIDHPAEVVNSKPVIQIMLPVR